MRNQATGDRPETPNEDALTPDEPVRQYVKVFGRSLRVPGSKAGRIALGSGLVVGGIFSFLPILGLWMLPLGLLILGQDIAFVRRQRRKLAVRYSRWRRGDGEKDQP